MWSVLVSSEVASAARNNGLVTKGTLNIASNSLGPDQRNEQSDFVDSPARLKRKDLIARTVLSPLSANQAGSQRSQHAGKDFTEPRALNGAQAADQKQTKPIDVPKQSDRLVRSNLALTNLIDARSPEALSRSAPSSPSARDRSVSPSTQRSSSPKTQRWEARWFCDQFETSATASLVSPLRKKGASNVIRGFGSSPDSSPVTTLSESAFKSPTSAGNRLRQRRRSSENHAKPLFDDDCSSEKPNPQAKAVNLTPPASPVRTQTQLVHGGSKDRLDDEANSRSHEHLPPKSPRRASLPRTEQETTAISPRTCEEDVETHAVGEVIPTITLRRGSAFGRRSKPEVETELARVIERLTSLMPIERRSEKLFTKDELAIAMKELFDWPEFITFAMCVRLSEVRRAMGWKQLHSNKRVVLSTPELSIFWHERVDTSSRSDCLFNIIVPWPKSGKAARTALEFHDLYTFVRALVHQHEDLKFLRSDEHAEFRDRYCETVAVRIMYNTGRSKLNVSRARFLNSDFTDAVFALKSPGSINSCLRYFSYEHFYVIYVKFWALDADHDLWISGQELLSYGEDTWTTAIVESMMVQRPVFQTAKRTSMMHFLDFIWVILSEEDKTTPTAIEFWFRCLDRDGDGVISLFELEHFYQEQYLRMREVDADDATKLEDALCIIIDAVRPASGSSITLSELKKCKQVAVVLNLLFSLRAMFEGEQLHPSDRLKYDRMRAGIVEPSPWETFAREAYIAMADEDSSSGSDSDCWISE